MASAELTVIQVLQAMAASDNLAENVLYYLNDGMWDEWDTDLPSGLKQGFGGQELQLAAKSGLCLAEYHKDNE